MVALIFDFDRSYSCL